MIIQAILAVCVAYLISVSAMPLVRRAAVHRKLLDRPDDLRRRHAGPIPRLGGVAVFASVVVVGVAGAMMGDRDHIIILLPFILSIAAGATIVFIVGLVDDIVGVRPLYKIIAQSAAAIIVFHYGFRLDVLMLTPNHQIALGILSLPVTVLWIVGLSNAFNLVDGADGLAGGVAAIALVSTAISAAFLRDFTVVFCAVTLLGAMIGFLRFNWPPARIFLGDSGSLVVGFLLAVLTVKGATQRDGAVYLLAPIFALSYPLLDTGISMLRRWLRGDPLSRADGRHVHHQLQALGLGPKQSVLLIYALSAVVAILGLSATFAPPQFTLAIAVAGAALLVLIFAYGMRWLQYHEFLEAGASLGGAARTGRAVIREKILARDVALLLRAAPTFEHVKEILEGCAERFRWVHVELQGRDSLPHFDEPNPVQSFGTATWKVEYPVTRLDSELAYPVILAIWCPLEWDGPPPAGAERVAHVLAPAVAEWFSRHSWTAEAKTALADRFPGLTTPPHGIPMVTGEFGLADLSEPRRESRRQLNGD